MAFPAVAAVNGGNNVVDNTNHTVNLPAGIVAGHLLLVFFACDTIGADVITFPNEGVDWFELFETQDAVPRVRFGCWYRIADGTEGATITVTTTTAQMSAHTSYRITGYSGTPEVGAAASGATANPDPPNLIPSWGAEDTLWFAAQGNDRDQTVAAYPANYLNGRNDLANDPLGCGVGTARRELNAASDNPGTFTISAADEWVANTVAVRPAAVAAMPYNAGKVATMIAR